ncbi:MAG: hypothetical protein KDD36_00075 [Flavobacteriales bacterium]|nr:hypothetical protein [Flavobacteriales bacterium]
MRKSFALACLLLGMSTTIAVAQNKSIDPIQAQYAIGIRAGDPFGLTVIDKRTDHAFEFSAGLASFAGLYHYYEKNFERWRGFNDYTYRDSQKNYGYSLQLHYLRYRELGTWLQWYYGGGGQMRFFSIWYEYDVSYYDVVAKQNKQEVWNATAVEKDMGVDLVAGIDYTFAGVPLNVFVDVTGYVELWENPGKPLLQAGIGLRYILE